MYVPTCVHVCVGAGGACFHLGGHRKQLFLDQCFCSDAQNQIDPVGSENRGVFLFFF